MTEPVHVPSPETVARSRMTAFARAVAAREGDPALASDEALARFALERPERFWRLLWDFLAVPSGGDPEPSLVGREVETARFFPNVRLSYAEALLAGAPDAPAVTSLSEDAPPVRLTRGALRDRVLRLAAALESLGVRPGDHVAAVARSTADTVVAALAAAAAGATWSAVGPDMAPEAILDRFRPLAPRVLFAHRRWRHQGQERDLSPAIAAVEAGLPTLEHVLDLDDLAAVESSAPAGAGERPFVRRPFDRPLLVLFSSGTTGPPKAIVHGQGGTLLEHLKELVLHTDLGPGDRLYFQTSAAWMMWSWQLSALGAGAEIVLYDGAVAWPEPDSLLRLLAARRVTVVGTGPAYLQMLEDGGVRPPPWPELRALLSTGSILHDRQYDFVRNAFGDLPLQSISGGTDLVGCFVLGHPNRPVHRGECSSVSLGLDVRVVPSGGGAPERTGTGELVCCAPFPSRPIGLLGDPGGARFHAAWFAEHTLDGAPIWTHGDLLTLTERGTARMLGRSDGVLNVKGVRIGPAEIYAALADHPAVAECLAVDQAWPRAVGGRRLVLLVLLRAGRDLDRPLVHEIKRILRDRRSRDHVPDLVVAVPDLPTTVTGKRSERAASDVLNGREVRNRAALRNPEVLDLLASHPELRPPA